MNGRRWISSLGLCSAFAAVTGCVNVSYNHVSIGEPIEDAQLSNVRPGSAELQECLDALGAPNLIWTSEDGRLSMAYAWIDNGNWGFAISYAFDQLASASASLTTRAFEAQSVVLSFDDSLQLTKVSRGYLWDIAPSAQQSTAARRMIDNTPR